MAREREREYKSEIALSFEDGITKMGSKIFRRWCGMDLGVEIRWTRTREVQGRTEQETMKRGEYECCELSILRISLANRAELSAVAKGERALQR